MIAAPAPPRRSPHLGPIVTAVAVGVLVWAAARQFASDSCPANDAVATASSCRVLVGSLAARVGAVAGAAVLLMELLAAGLLRTAETMDRDRRQAHGEADGEARAGEARAGEARAGEADGEARAGEARAGAGTVRR